MNDDQLLELAKQYVDAKAGYANDELKAEMAKELKSQMEDAINMQLLGFMTPAQIDGFNQLLDSDNNTDEAMVEYIKGCDIDIDIVTTAALTKIRLAYLGA